MRLDILTRKWFVKKHPRGSVVNTLWQVNLWLRIYEDAPLVPSERAFLVKAAPDPWKALSVKSVFFVSRVFRA